MLLAIGKFLLKWIITIFVSFLWLMFFIWQMEKPGYVQAIFVISFIAFLVVMYLIKGNFN